MMKADTSLDLEYVNERIANYGCIEEYDDGISYCPYCGYANKLDFESRFEVYRATTECSGCDKTYLETREVDFRVYTKTERLKEEVK
jgi:hypothetical protein